MVTNIGYKNTDIGVIPMDWDCIHLCTLGKLLSGLTYTPEDVKNYGLLVLRSSNIQEGRLCFKDNVYVNCKIEADKYVKQGDLLICVRNGSRALIGKCALIDKNYNATFGAFMALFRSPHGKYLYQLFSNNTIQEQINRNCGATINQITSADFNRFLVAFPQNPKEQAAISEALSDVDNLTSSLQKLIEKKKAIKQGAMQELLTGKKRLPGFYGEWKREQLPELLQEQNGIKIGPFGSQLKKEYLIDIGEFKVYGQENVYEKDFRLGTRYIPKERYLKLKSCELLPGDFVISSMGTVGKCAIVPQNIQIGIMDSHLIRLKFNCKKIIPQYILQLFSDEFDFLRNQIEKLSVGGIMDGLSTKIVQSLHAFYPVNIDEQKAICAILNDMDDEIAQLEKKLAKYQQIKQGMMQELLTGRIRLV